MNEVLIGIIAAVTGGGMAGLLSVLQRRRLISSQVNKLDAEASRIALQTLTESMEKLRTDYMMLTEEADSLKREIDKLKREQNRLRRAIEKISSCAHGSECPVAKELSSNKPNDKEP